MFNNLTSGGGWERETWFVTSAYIHDGNTPIMADFNVTSMNAESERDMCHQLLRACGNRLLHTSEIFLNTKLQKSMANHSELAQEKK